MAVPETTWGGGTFVCGDGGSYASVPSSDGHNYCKDSVACPCGSCCYCECNLAKGTPLPRKYGIIGSRRRVFASVSR